MPISVQITAETADEYAEAIQVLSGLFRPRPWQSIPEPLPLADADPAPAEDKTIAPAGELPADLPDELEPTATEDVTAELAKPKRTRGRPRRAAQEAPEAAPEAPQAAQDAPEAAPEAPEAAPEASEADLDAVESASNPYEDAPAAQPAPQADLFASEDAQADPAKDKAEALDLLRALYDRDGMAPRINELLAGYGVSKFTLIAAAHGTELLAQARQLDTENPA